MSDDSRQNTTHSDAESEIWDAISAFEKIIEALPNDRISLEALADAYEQVGDHTRAKDYMIRLANVLLDEGDDDGAQDLVRKIRVFEATDPDIAAVIARIEGYRPEKVMAVVEEAPDSMARSAAEGISDEIAFAWSLMQAGKLSQDDYSNVVHDLTENSAKSADIVISTLHVLNDRAVKNMSDILAYAADECGTPIIGLHCFDTPVELMGIAPLNLMIRRKMLPFETMGNDLLVAILNPYDTKLKNDLETLTGRICHFYLAQPADFDLALDKIRKALAESAKTATESRRS